MSEGLKMLLIILIVFFVFLPLFILPQVRRENRWYEEDMIDSDKDKKSRDDDKDTREF